MDKNTSKRRSNMLSVSASAGRYSTNEDENLGSHFYDNNQVKYYQPVLPKLDLGIINNQNSNQSQEN